MAYLNLNSKSLAFVSDEPSEESCLALLLVTHSTATHNAHPTANAAQSVRLISGASSPAGVSETR